MNEFFYSDSVAQSEIDDEIEEVTSVMANMDLTTYQSDRGYID